MSTFKRGRYYHYEFEFEGQRYRSTTKQTTKRAADRVEADVHKRVEEQSRGVAIEEPVESPRMQDWAEIYLADVYTRAKLPVGHKRYIARPERIEEQLRVVLRFWGAKPARRELLPKAGEDAPFHDLRLDDPSRDPKWLIRFEEWMTARGVAGDTRNHYRTTVSQLYDLARLPHYRQETRITQNPMDGVPRDPRGRSTTTLTLDEARAILSHAAYHVRLATAIGALAPKLRKSSILRLQWDTPQSAERDGIDPELRYITVWKHKTVGKTGKPQVAPIVDQLRRILLDAFRRRRGKHVIAYRGAPIDDLRGGLRAAVKAAGLEYGKRTGITFHTLRHTAATLLAELDVAPDKRGEATGHADQATVLWYTHLRPAVQLPVLEVLSNALPIEDLVTQAWTRPNRTGTLRRGGKIVGTTNTRDTNDAEKYDVSDAGRRGVRRTEVSGLKAVK